MSAERANQLVEAGVWLQATGDVHGARRLFEQALKLDPQNARAKSFLAPGPVSKPALGTSPTPGSNPFQRPLAATPTPSPPPAAPPAAPASSPPPPPDVDLDVDWADATNPTFQWDAKRAEAQLPKDASSAWDTDATDVDLEIDVVPPDWADPMALLKEQSRPPTEPASDASGLQGQQQAELDALIAGAEDLVNLDDHSGAIELIHKAERLRGSDPRVKALKRRSEAVLEGMFESKLGALDRKPKVVLKDDEIIWLNLDHRAGFVLAQIDGTVTIEDVFAVSGMSRLDTARILAQLLDEGVIVTG